MIQHHLSHLLHHTFFRRLLGNFSNVLFYIDISEFLDTSLVYRLSCMRSIAECVNFESAHLVVFGTDLCAQKHF